MMKKVILFASALMIVAGMASAASLAVVPAAAYDGTYGLRVTLDSTSNAFVQDNSPNDETVYRVSFKVRNNLVMSNGTAHNMFRARMVGKPIFQVQAARDYAGNYVVYALAYKDDGTVTGAFATFLNTNNSLTFEWTAATAPGANDGTFRMYKGTNLRGELTGIDNDTHAIAMVQMGAFGGIDATTSGTMDFDSFESFRSLLP